MGLFEHLPYTNFHELNLAEINKVIDGLPALIRKEIEEILVDYTIPDGAVTTPKIADYNVTTQKLANLSVTTAKLANQAVSNAKLLDGAVTESKIRDASVTTAKLNLQPVALFSSNDAYSLDSGTTFTTVGDSFTIEPGLYLLILYARKGIMAGTPASQLFGARVTADGSSAITRNMEIRSYTGPAAASFCSSVIMPFTETTTLYMQGFQNSGQTNPDVRFSLQGLKLAER